MKQYKLGKLNELKKAKFLKTAVKCIKGNVILALNYLATLRLYNS